MAIRRYIGYVRTKRAGSEVEFEFEVNDDRLPEDPKERRASIEDAARDALFDSCVWEWGYNEEAE